MTKKYILFLSAVCFSAIVSAQTAVVTPADASATVTKAVQVESLGLPETEFDFGKIPQGKPVTHIFSVVNTGTDSLKIGNVQASCGCTTPEWDRDKVQAPGQKTAITVGYNAANEGVFNKTITVTYNGTQTKQITIKGEVWKTPTTSAPENKELGSLKDQ